VPESDWFPWQAGVLCGGFLSVFDLEASEEVFQLRDVPFGRSMVSLVGRQFHVVADVADLIEAVPPSVAFHSMSQYPNSRKVLIGQRMTKRVEVFSPVGQKVGYNIFKVAVDVYDHSPG
jgi:hypothetical protein